MPFNLGSRSWTRLLLVAIGLYIALLPLWWYLLPALAVVTGTAADWIYTLFDSQVSINPDGRIVRIVLGEAGGQGAPSGLRLDTVSYGIPILAALVIATRSDSIKAKLRALVIGIGVMIALVVPAVMTWAKLTSLQAEEQLTPSGDRSSLLFYAFHGYAFSQPAIAVALWLAMIMLGLFKSERKIAMVVGAPRNAACPCGSGRKYKKCCGRR